MQRLAREFPAIALLGARQIGKSSLAKLAFPDHARLDLEIPLWRHQVIDAIEALAVRDVDVLVVIDVQAGVEQHDREIPAE